MTNDDDHAYLTGLPPPLRAGDSPETKRRAYTALLDAVKLVLARSDDPNAAAAGLDAVAAMSTVSHLLSRSLGHCSWVGFYRASQDALVVGPYCGASMGCLRIPHGRGVCGAAARERRTQIVPDVSLFPGHIACASSTRSEIVVPVFEGGDAEGGRVAAVLDLDSETEAAFDGEDGAGLEALALWLGRAFFPPPSSPAAGGRGAAGAGAGGGDGGTG